MGSLTNQQRVIHQIPITSINRHAKEKKPIMTQDVAKFIHIKQVSHENVKLRSFKDIY